MNWELKNKSESELKQIAKDLYNGLIFTDRSITDGNIQRNFIVLNFMYPKKPEPPKYPSDSVTVSGNRDNRIYDLIQRESDQKKYEEDLKNFPEEEEKFKSYLENIGLVFEYMDKAMPMAMNGKPIFFSANFLSKEDSEKMFQFYNQYKEIREKCDNF